MLNHLATISSCRAVQNTPTTETYIFSIDGQNTTGIRYYIFGTSVVCFHIYCIYKGICGGQGVPSWNHLPLCHISVPKYPEGGQGPLGDNKLPWAYIKAQGSAQNTPTLMSIILDSEFPKITKISLLEIPIFILETIKTRLVKNPIFTFEMFKSRLLHFSWIWFQTCSKSNISTYAEYMSYDIR